MPTPRTVDPRTALAEAVAHMERDRDGYRKTDLVLAEEFAEDGLALAARARDVLDAFPPPRPGVWDVTWHTTLDAEEAASPVEAAVRARLHQRPGTSAVVFTVTGPDGTRTEVDLGTGLDQTEPPALALAAVSRWTDDLTQPADNPRAALRAALAEWDELTTGERPLALADVARALAVTGSRVLNWLEDNDLDPGNPPSCSCGGRHWSCDYDPDAPVCESCGEPGPGLAIIRDQLTCEQCAAEDEEEEPEVCRQCCTETQGLEVIQGTPLCEACIAYNVSRCL